MSDSNTYVCNESIGELIETVGIPRVAELWGRQHGLAVIASGGGGAVYLPPWLRSLPNQWVRLSAAAPALILERTNMVMEIDFQVVDVDRLNAIARRPYWGAAKTAALSALPGVTARPR